MTGINSILTFGIGRQMEALNGLVMLDDGSVAELGVGMDTMNALRNAGLVDVFAIGKSGDPRWDLVYTLTDKGRAMHRVHSA